MAFSQVGKIGYALMQTLDMFGDAVQGDDSTNFEFLKAEGEDKRLAKLEKRRAVGQDRQADKSYRLTLENLTIPARIQKREALEQMKKATLEDLQAQIKGEAKTWTAVARSARASVGFLDLPAELRTLVYGFAVTDKNLKRKRQVVIASSKQTAFKTYLALVQTCHQLKSEVTPIFFANNVFSFNMNLLHTGSLKPVLVTNRFAANLQMLTISNHKAAFGVGASFTMRIEKIRGTTDWAVQMTDPVPDTRYPPHLLKASDSINCIRIVQVQDNDWYFVREGEGLLAKLVRRCDLVHTSFMCSKSGFEF